ncbi:MAG: hypothetical protein IJH12_07155 [Clostridia bacterium]|nr:hypothetical protein [Clostridia bacterium]
MKSRYYSAAMFCFSAGPILMILLTILGISKQDYAFLYTGAVMIHALGVVFSIKHFPEVNNDSPPASTLMLLGTVGAVLNYVVCRF